MPQPSPSWQTVRVYGTWREAEDGSLKAGSYVATIPVRLVSAADDSIFPPGVVAEGDLNTSVVDNDPGDGYPDGPSLDLQLPATDDPDIVGASWLLTIVVTFDDGQKETYVLSVPLAQSANGVNLLNYAPQETILPSSIYGGSVSAYPMVYGGTA